MTREDVWLRLTPPLHVTNSDHTPGPPIKH